MVTPRAHRLSRRSEEDDNQSSADLIMKEVKKTYCLRSELLLSSSDSSGLSGFGSLDLTLVVSRPSDAEADTEQADAEQADTEQVVPR